MLDLKFIRDNVELVKENVARRGVKNADPDRVVELNAQRINRLQELETLRAMGTISDSEYTAKRQQIISEL